jgi:lysophospholipase L1-like esterase
MRSAGVFFFLLVSFSATLGQSWDTIPVLPDHYRSRLEQFRKEKGSTGKIIFIGNSITEGGNFRKLVGDSVINRGIGGDITFGVLNRLEEATRFRPSKMFILIGVNDLSKHIPENVILQNVFTIVNLVHSQSPTTVVFVQSILPVNPGVKDFPKGYDVNESLERINRELANMQKRVKYTFVDLSRSFADADGLMDVKYTTDGLHLNPAGYGRWIKILKEGKHL